MKHFLILLLLSAVPVSFAESFTTKKDVYCDKTEILISLLKGQDYEETPIWLGKGIGPTPNYSLFTNVKTKTWTIIQFNNDLACVLGTGDSYVNSPKKTTV